MNPVPLIGDVRIQLDLFPKIDVIVAHFQTKSFGMLPENQRLQQVNKQLFDLILGTPSPAFLLAAVIDYIVRINSLKILKDDYHISHFEFWLNNFEDASSEQKYEIRAKICGQHVPREDYQLLFPIGMGHFFPGSHFVTAHLSPDIDTTIASFWGWLDAFAAQVSRGLHIWNLPGGPPDSPITQLFKDHFGPSIFSNLARQGGTLTLSAIDLVSTKNKVLAKGNIQASSMVRGFEEKAVLLIDEEGHYQGDWRIADVEPIRQILILFNWALNWFETTIHSKLIALFSQEALQAADIKPFVSSLFDLTLDQAEPIKDYTDQQRHLLDEFLRHIIRQEKGLQSSFYAIAENLQDLGLKGLSLFYKELLAIGSSEIFDPNGHLIEDRPKIFALLQRLISHLDHTTHGIRAHLERLDIAMQIKYRVLSKSLHYLTLKNDIEDIKIKMSNYSYLTVVFPEENGLLHPIGVIWAQDLRQSTLGTVSFRDFCNFEEVKMASNLSVISVVDHHKSALKTNTTPLAIIGDAQSCNVLVAELAMELNDRYSTAGLGNADILEQIEQLKKSPSFQNTQLLQRVLKRLIAAETKGPYYIHPLREFTEYLYFIHAILDDTDLLTKVSCRDVHCVAELLNRMKSLAVKQEMEILHLDDLPKNPEFPMAAAQRILKHPDMYSIYKKIYLLKESEVSKNIDSCLQGMPTNLFLDTKEQNGCCRVGQTKLFKSNIPLFEANSLFLQQTWLKIALKTHASSPEIDLHLQMISTIASADDIYHATDNEYPHKDEIWFWLPDTEQAQSHLAIFLGAFQGASEVKDQKMELEIRGHSATKWQEIFYRNFSALNKDKTLLKPTTAENIIVLKFKAGSINSRKSMISPYLPKLIS